MRVLASSGSSRSAGFLRIVLPHSAADADDCWTIGAAYTGFCGNLSIIPKDTQATLCGPIEPIHPPVGVI